MNLPRSYVIWGGIFGYKCYASLIGHKIPSLPHNHSYRESAGQRAYSRRYLRYPPEVAREITIVSCKDMEIHDFLKFDPLARDYYLERKSLLLQKRREEYVHFHPLSLTSNVSSSFKKCHL